jgi:hypothetical protein
MSIGNPRTSRYAWALLDRAFIGELKHPLPPTIRLDSIVCIVVLWSYQYDQKQSAAQDAIVSEMGGLVQAFCLFAQRQRDADPQRAADPSQGERVQERMRVRVARPAQARPNLSGVGSR